MGGAVSNFAFVRQDFLEPLGRMCADVLKDVAEVDEGIDLEPFAFGDEAGEDRRGSPAALPVQASSAIQI